MYLDNKIIVLIAIYNLRNEYNTVTFKELLDNLPLEKSHISHSLKSNEKMAYIQKPEDSRYFSSIQITSNGIKKALNHISFLQNLLKLTTPSPYKKSNVDPRDSKILPNFKLVLASFISEFYSPLKNTLKDSLQEYIPESHLTDNLLDDLTDNVLSFFHNQFTSYYKSKILQ